jgi:phosphonate transport system permease protein
MLTPRTGWMVAGLFALAWSLYRAGFLQQDLVNYGGWTVAWRFVQAAARPELAPDFLILTLDATVITLGFALCGTALSLVIGFVGGLLSSEVWWRSLFASNRVESGSNAWRIGYRAPWLFMRGLFAIPRSIHEIIWGIFFVNIIGLDPLVAILAIAIPFGAITAKVFSEILDETPRHSLQGLLNGGVSTPKAILYSLLPQAFPNLLSYSFYRLECAIRSAAVLGIIGAGGLGYQIMLSFQSLRYEPMWTLFIALFALCGVTDLWSGVLRRQFGAASRIDLKLGKSTAKRAATQPNNRVIQGSLLFVAILLPFSIWYVQADFSKLWADRTLLLLGDVTRSAYPPRLLEGDLARLLLLSGQTLAMSILAMAFACLGGLLLAFPAASTLTLPGGVFAGGRSGRLQWLGGATVLTITRLILLVTRALPTPVWALLLMFVLFPGILPGAIALGLHTLGILGRLMAEVIENLDDRPLRALHAQGASGPQVFLYGILPRTLPGFTAYSLYRWEVCIRETVIVGIVGAGGLGMLMLEQINTFNYRSLIVTLACFIGLTLFVDLISASVRRSLR